MDPGTLWIFARRHWAVITLAAAAVITLVALATSPPHPPAHNGAGGYPPSYEIHGLVAITGPAGILVSTSDTIPATGDPVCWGQSQYQDIGLGVTVTVFDDQDRIVGEGALGQGRAPQHRLPVNGSCFFPIVVPDVPAQSAFYQVEIARRGTVLVENMPENGALYAFIALDDETGSLPAVADQRPRLPAVVG